MIWWDPSFVQDLRLNTRYGVIGVDIQVMALPVGVKTHKRRGRRKPGEAAVIAP